MESKPATGFFGRLAERWKRFTPWGKIGFISTILGIFAFGYTDADTSLDMIWGAIASIFVVPLIVGVIPWLWKKYKKQTFDIWNFGYKWYGILILSVFVFSLTVAFIISLSEPKENTLTWNRDGISFTYPDSETVIIDQYGFDPIELHKSNLDSVMRDCDEQTSGMGLFTGYDQFKLLETLRDEGVTYENSAELLKLDPVSCGHFGSAEDIQPFKIGNLNAVILTTVRGDDCCWYENFSKELIIVNWYGEVYTLTVRASLGEGKTDYSTYLKEEFSWENHSEKAKIAEDIFSSVSLMR